MNFDILIAGVGGQGTVLASRILGEAAIESGFFARTGETIGMAQRGGCVVSHVRIDSEDKSPVIPMGRADLLIGFEPAETARNICRLKKDGNCIVNVRPVKPVTASLMPDTYDEKAVFEYIVQNSEACFVDGSGAAEECGNLKTLNIVMLAAAAGRGVLPFSCEVLKNAMKKLLPEKVLELNLKAFEKGINLVCEVRRI